MFDCSAAAMGKAGQSSAGVSQEQADYTASVMQMVEMIRLPCSGYVLTHTHFSLFTAFS